MTITDGVDVKPPPSIGGRFRHDPFLRVLGSLVGTSSWILDHSHNIQRRLNRRPRQLPGRSDRHSAVILDKKIVAEDEHVVQMTLCAPDGGALPAWHPGAHIDVFLPSGRRRQYSLCGDPGNVAEYRIAVRRIPGGGGGSIEMHDLTIGARIQISSPRNAFYMAIPGAGSSSTRLRFIAGGIGITPILPMLRLADHLELDWSMLYTGRHRASLPFLHELTAYGERVTVRTDDQHGLPNAAVLLERVDERTAIYACGPAAMIATTRAGLAVGSKTELHHERFSAPMVVDGIAFDIELARSGETVTVEADESALEAIRRLRPNLAYSCQQGFCGTCVQRVLSGNVRHRDQLLTDLQHQNGQMLICVSRAEGQRLVLDL
ncbi:ferredoxin [Mycobacteroides stephanolepidis]|uniref:Ferredoxin n=1 Tax=[Mycobacterium] stephanolepidis TaxID=1520670 RepID=A0A1Z4F3Z4_9MYCO|nr:PDR/VanB family oxidoreductase [[Mycobacterium] stephanolepidis]BAX99963.1 ferredoxin [[Mycobacterium] stephanolepidis]